MGPAFQCLGAWSIPMDRLEALMISRVVQYEKPPPFRDHALAGSGRMRRDGRVVEGARLESVYTGNRIAGSNPALSAKH
jgi:hypothetical protein